MKKQVVIIGLALLTLGAVSCKKDYVCDCHIDYSGGHAAGDHGDFEYEYKGVKKSDAEESCKAQEELYEMNAEVDHAHCELK